MLILKGFVLFAALFFTAPIVGAIMVTDRRASATQNALASFLWALFYVLSQIGE